ncbi:MAG: NADPH-dependent FMN reductase [Spirochaetae bacterium HGW-Spirochaetae-3]|jgi:NAD(P)H-dependent FMN reductase|nr:MAG: NADPH-dependent FMN reductase [Spirochaetae bacterium HGW-Spirochaetae-3]
MSVIKIVIGSTRPQRFGPAFASWIKSEVEAFTAANQGAPRFELVDLVDLGLPLLDESAPASTRNYTQEHTKRWSRIVDEADGFLFLVPEYNHGMSAALKNAVDYLFYEWNYKPTAFASYGGAAGGARAVEQLREVCGEMKIYDIRESVLVPNYWNQLDATGAFVPSADQKQAAQAMLAQLSFWTDAMKAPRESLTKKA